MNPARDVSSDSCAKAELIILEARQLTWLSREDALVTAALNLGFADDYDAITYAVWASAKEARLA